MTTDIFAAERQPQTHRTKRISIRPIVILLSSLILLLVTGIALQATGFSRAVGLDALLFSSLPLGEQLGRLLKPPIDTLAGAVILFPLVSLLRQVWQSRGRQISTLITTGCVAIATVLSLWVVISPSGWDGKGSDIGVSASKSAVSSLSLIEGSDDFETKYHYLSKKAEGKRIEKLGGIEIAEFQARNALRGLPDALGLGAQFYIQILILLAPILLLIGFASGFSLGWTLMSCAGAILTLATVKWLTTASSAMLLVSPTLAVLAALGGVLLIRASRPFWNWFLGGRTNQQPEPHRVDTPPQGVLA